MSPREVAPITRPLTQAMIDAYADASGDHNPIHIDHDFARATPMGGTIAHGMLVLAFISEMMTATFANAWLASGKLYVRFRAPARPGDTITARARPAGEDGARQRFTVECLNQSDEVLIAGAAEVTLDG